MKVIHANRSNIVQLQPRVAQMKFLALAQVEAYWTALANNGEIPMRSEIDPRGLEDALEYAFILERVDTGVARFRIAGGHLCDLMGMEVRGMPLTAIFNPEARNSVCDLIERVCQTPEILEITLDGGSGIGRSPLEAKMFLAPLRSEKGHVNRLLGCLQSQGQIGRQPRRFEISNEKATKIPTSVVYAASEKQTIKPNQLAETRAPYDHTQKAEKPDVSRPALRLVSDND